MALALSLLLLLPSALWAAAQPSPSTPRVRVRSPAAAPGCAWTKGAWLPAPSLPLYTGFSCSNIRSSQNCARIGRTDMSYQKWRWHPLRCRLSMVTPRRLASTLRNKFVFVVGDSVSSNLAASFSCILNANPIKMVPWQATFNGHTIGGSRLPGYNVRFSSFFSNNLNRISPIPGAYGHRVDLDQIDPAIAAVLPLADIIIFMAVDWWSIPSNQYFIGGKQVQLKYLDAYRLGMSSLAHHIQSSGFKGRAFLMSASPTHYNLPPGLAPRPGSCEVYHPLTTQQDLAFEARNQGLWAILAVQRAVASNASALALVDITHMTAFRADAHLAGTGRKPGTRNDCLHWCEGGVTDAWVEIIYNKLLQ